MSATGVSRVAEELTRAIGDILANEPDILRGREIRVLAPDEADAARREGVQALNGIPVYRGGWFSGKFRNLIWEQCSLPFMARRGLLVNLCNSGPIWHSHSISLIHDAQVYLTPQSYGRGFRQWYRFMLPILGRRSARILTVSQYSKTQLVAHGVASADKITVIHNGCDQVLRMAPDTDFPQRLGLTTGGYVVALANTQAHKNIQVLLRAFMRPELQDMTLVLFGADGRQDFENKGLEVPDNVVFAGRVSDPELAGLIQGACAMACPSLTEGFGLPPLEAMRLGCPAIIAPCGALPEVCGEAALWADPHAPAQWAAHIRRLRDDQPFSLEMRSRGVVQASDFTWARAARRLLDVVVSVP
ncbi:glycosyltransferase family 4 protein [Asticcacaulis tiandongensis]|uniref:glycosyltransferase family 4 protein n=1 Tax=Asticcacaulis tiandongensis TaxID=2565365 RepID=UPI001C63CE1D|nr:glycosyltransferase family 1 protein [Asticcacaulis tiandongensis]